MKDGFVDLRPGHHSDVVQDSFWPSFTDVMMVVVMIFIMASLVMVVKNWELVHELRDTIKAEHEAQEFIQATTESNNTLSEQLTDTEYQLSQLRMQMMRIEEESSKKSQQLNERNRQLQASRNQIEMLTIRIDEATSMQQQTTNHLARMQELSKVQQQQLYSAQQQRSTLEEQLQDKVIELDKVQQARITSESLTDELQDSYNNLELKYNKLIKPARTAKGRYVVEVRYEKRGKHYHIQYKDPSDKNYTKVSRKELEIHLAELKKKYSAGLYIKIIIPSKSGLSYNEAWRFTSEILAEYDYYGQ